MTPKERLEAQATFLGRFARDGNVTEACLDAGIHRSRVYQWKETSKAFADLFKDAEEQVNDAIRSELFRRAVTGDEEYVVSMGQVVYKDGVPLTVRKRSDQLLMFLAKARMAEFKEKQHVEHSGAIDIQGAKERLLAKLARLPDPEPEDNGGHADTVAH